MLDTVLTWLTEHAAVAAASMVAGLIIVGCWLAVLFTGWQEELDRRAMVRHLKRIDQHAADLRRQGR